MSKKESKPTATLTIIVTYSDMNIIEITEHVKELVENARSYGAVDACLSLEGSIVHKID